MRRTNIAELRAYVKEWLETNFQNGLIGRNERTLTLHTLSSFLPDAVRVLNRGNPAVLSLGAKAITVHLREGRELDHKFNLFEMEWPRSRRKSRRLRCFVGHRFAKSISNALRFNLRHCLEPSNIELLWSGRDLNAVGFFDEIVDLIQSSAFCIFDNRNADKKPNVYIELGIAYALRKPFLFANYIGNRIGIPSDLTHITNIPYRDYCELSKKVYFHLPSFLNRHGLRP